MSPEPPYGDKPEEVEKPKEKRKEVQGPKQKRWEVAVGRAKNGSAYIGAQNERTQIDNSYLEFAGNASLSFLNELGEGGQSVLGELTDPLNAISNVSSGILSFSGDLILAVPDAIISISGGTSSGADKRVISIFTTIVSETYNVLVSSSNALNTMDGDAFGKTLFSGIVLGVGKGKGGAAKSTTILGENMMKRVIPYANNTGARTIPFGTSRENWAKLTYQQRWRLNDGAIRKRINEGDEFKYIGRDPGGNPALRKKFDLTGSELLRLNDRKIPYETVNPN